MRTFRDAKAMAKSLGSCLAAQHVELTHSQCLEIVARQFGFANWNTLSARMLRSTAPQEPRSCSFCGKSQHEVRGLVEGEYPRVRRVPSVQHSQESSVFICDECVRFSAGVVTDILGNATG